MSLCQSTIWQWAFWNPLLIVVKITLCYVYLPLPFSPKARAGGTVIFRFSPGHMSSIPISRPLMTCPTPSTNHWGCPVLSDRLEQRQLEKETASCQSIRFHINRICIWVVRCKWTDFHFGQGLYHYSGGWVHFYKMKNKIQPPLPTPIIIVLSLLLHGEDCWRPKKQD